MFTNLYEISAQQKKAETIRRNNELYTDNDEYLVIEKSTGKPVGDGKPMTRMFAEYVCGVRDLFKTGEFFLQKM